MVSHCSHALDIKEMYLVKTPIAFHVIVLLLSSWLLNPFAPGNFAEKRVLNLVIIWAYKELKLTLKLFAGHAFHGFLIQMQNIKLQNLSMCRRKNLEIVFGFKSDTAVFFFSLSFLPCSFAFLVSFFFFCLGFSRNHFGGNSF